MGNRKVDLVDQHGIAVLVLLVRDGLSRCLQLAVEVDAYIALVERHGDMIPAVRLQLERGRSYVTAVGRPLVLGAEGDLNLVHGDVGVTHAQQKNILDAHDRRNLLFERVAVNERFEREAFHVLDRFGLARPVGPRAVFVHVGHDAYCRAVVERIGLDDRVAHLDGNVQYHAVYRGTYLGIAYFGVAGDDAVAYDFQIVACALEVLFRNPELCLRLLELVEGDDVLPVEFFGAFVFAPGLFQIYFRLLDSRFGVVEGTHLRNDLHGSDYVALPHHVACLLVQGGDDARNLGLDEYFVARFDLSGGYHELGDGVA